MDWTVGPEKIPLLQHGRNNVESATPDAVSDAQCDKFTGGNK
jgi:hypothetical protein